MLNFEFHNPTRIVFGPDRLEALGRYIPATAKVLITYGQGSVVRTGLLERVKTALGARRFFEFGGIEPNPRYETLMKATEVVRGKGVDFLLAVGGGSVIDGTKFIAIAACYDGNAEDLLYSGGGARLARLATRALPLASVLTLPATGSEMNRGAVISQGEGKYPVMSEHTYPRFSILDPSLTYTLPTIQVANGIVDAFVHTTEQYLTYPVDARLQDRIAEGILQTLIEIGPSAIARPDDYDTRANLVWCATMALNGVIGAGVPQDWATHMMGHELTAMFGIDHGQTLAIILPALLDVRRDKKRAKLLQYAERVWNIRTGSEEERIDAAIASTRAFFESLGIRTRLSAYGIGADRVPDLVNALQTRGGTALSETGDQTIEISREILERAV